MRQGGHHSGDVTVPGCDQVIDYTRIASALGWNGSGTMVELDRHCRAQKVAQCFSHWEHEPASKVLQSLLVLLHSRLTAAILGTPVHQYRVDS